MVFLRIAVLSFWAFYAWGMGQIPASGLNAFGKLVAGSFFLAAPALYLLPIYEAWKQDHPNLTSIALVNIFLGWSLVGWIIALAWAYRKPEPVPIAVAAASPPAPAQATARERRAPSARKRFSRRP